MILINLVSPIGINEVQFLIDGVQFQRNCTPSLSPVKTSDCFLWEIFCIIPTDIDGVQFFRNCTPPFSLVNQAHLSFLGDSAVGEVEYSFSKKSDFRNLSLWEIHRVFTQTEVLLNVF